MRVIQLMRKPLEGYVSYERLFADIRQALPEDIEVRVVHSWFHSRGFFPRILNCIQAFFLRADVVHITGDIHYLAPALVGRRSVLTIHDLAPLHPKQGWQRTLFKFFWYTWPIRCASCTTTISDAIRWELLAILPVSETRIRTVHNCISPDFKPTPKEWSACPVVLMVGTLPQKNIERMCTALAGMKVQIQIVGRLSAAQRDTLDQLQLSYRELGRVSDEALLQAYRDCDLLAFASTYEGFGLPILEAQATGRPVLTSDIPALSEVAEKGALLVDPLDVDSIRQGFERLLSSTSLRESLIAKGFANAASYHALTVAQHYADIYRKLAASN